MSTVLITGANRGLGLALASRYAARPGTNVMAVARNVAESAELQALVDRSEGRVRAVRADVGDATSIAELVRAVGAAKIDLLVNNAGVSGAGDFGEITPEDLLEVFRVNAFAPVLVTQALRQALARGGKVVNITSVLGSLESARGSDGYLVYGMSKAALNMFSVKLAATLRERDVAVLALHPGWVRTRMGGSGAALSVETSADGMLRVIDALTMADTGSYRAYDGSAIAW